MKSKNDEIRRHPAEKTRLGKFSIVVSFRQAGRSNFSRRKFTADSESNVTTQATKFADSLPTLADWRTSIHRPRPTPRRPTDPRRVSGGSVFFAKSRGKWAGSVYIGRDESGKRILKVVYADAQAEAQAKLDRFIQSHNETIDRGLSLVIIC